MSSQGEAMASKGNELKINSKMLPILDKFFLRILPYQIMNWILSSIFAMLVLLNSHRFLDRKFEDYQVLWELPKETLITSEK